MPIYEYVCLDCKKEYEILRSFSESDKPVACNQCGGENVKRKLSVFYAQSGGHAVSARPARPGSAGRAGGSAARAGGAGGGCSSCAGGNCSSCGQ